LIEFPQRGRPIGVMGIRELAIPFGRSAYVLRYFYSAGGDSIVILHIWHGRERRE
jgi:plasmid stabilization system protein ParE